MSNKEYGFDSIESSPNLGYYLTRKNDRVHVNAVLETQMELVDTSKPDAEEDSRMRRDTTMMGLKHQLPADYVEEESHRSLGTFDGVFLYVAVSIFGVVLFTRMGWMVAYCGVGLSVFVVILSAIVTLVTTCSLSALVTNGKIYAGGPYLLVARSVGIEVGAVVGIMYTFAQVATIALNDVGFAESVVDSYAGNYFTGSAKWDTSLIALMTNFVMLLLCWIGVEWVNSSNLLFMLSIFTGLVSFIIGTFIRTSGFIEGYTGYSGSTISSQASPNFSADVSFFTVFGVFFPSVTGVLQGANLTAELKTPAKSIPFGTIIAIIFCSLVYIVILLICASTGTRDLLQNNLDFMGLVSAYKPLVLQGLYSAALSTSVGMLMGAPRIFIATLNDGLFPAWLNYFTVLNSKGDPMRGYILCTVIACVITLLGDSFDVIARLVSNLFMMVYGIINLACFLASYYSSPGWRPEFQYYNKWVALIGAIMCIVSMFVIDYVTGIIVFVLSVVLYKWVEYTKPKLSGAFEAQAFLSAVNSINQLETHTEGSIKNFRPSLMVIANCCSDDQAALQICGLFYKSRSLLMRGQVIIDEVCRSSIKTRSSLPSTIRAGKMIAINKSIIDVSLKRGVSSLLQLVGIGKLSPNTIVIEFKEDWRELPDKELSDFLDIIKLILRLDLAIIILRAPKFEFDQFSTFKGTVDVHWIFDDGGLTLMLAYLLLQSKSFSKCKLRVCVPPEDAKLKAPIIAPKDDLYGVEFPAESAYLADDIIAHNEKNLSASASVIDAPLESSTNSHAAISVQIDDINAGSSADTLSPRTRNALAKEIVWNMESKEAAKRDFDNPADRKEFVSEISQLMKLLRIKASTHTLVKNMSAPTSTLMDAFQIPKESLMSAAPDADSVVSPDSSVLNATKEYAQSINEFSRESQLVFISIPVPRSSHSARDYLSCLDSLSAGLVDRKVPVLFVRGNNQNILTPFL